MQNTSHRALALDALRGLAILLMLFSGKIPYGILPDWMYHAQVPPPDHRFNPALPGITWVDLVFPFFLFSMGAAIPLALSRRIAQGVPVSRIIGSVVWRSALLAFFAIYVVHIRPWNMPVGPDGRILPLSWATSLAGFLLLFPVLLQIPEGTSRAVRIGIRLGGWLGIGVLLALLRYRDGSGFSVTSNDIIILVLANVYLTGSLIWIATRTKPLLRVGIMAIVAALVLSAEVQGWIRPLWHGFPVPWLFNLAFQKYLLLIIPGTLIGELLLAWGSANEPETATRWSPGRFRVILLLMLGLNIAAVVGFKGRWVMETTVLLGALIGISLLLLRRPGTEREILLGSIFRWGAFFLILGCLLEPFEGGIKKDHATFSYYFVTGGLAIASLIFFLILIKSSGKRGWLTLLVGSGQNPLVAYAGAHALIPPLLGLLSLDVLLEELTPGAWPGVFRGALITTAVAGAAAYLTRRRIMLRA